jgi:pantoate--beta-alanine ligase
MKIAKTISSVRKLIGQARSKGKSVGFVPTMGALHKGHISLIKKAVKKTDFVVVSIFVNPTQFGPKEDFNKYPRPLQNDLKLCRKAGADVVFAPSAKQIYPQQNLTYVNVEKITEPLCGRFRQGHFRGVATICSKLFNIVQPNFAFFGQKDAQQTIVIKQMVADLNMPLKIVVCPTVREADGLAMSSRNQYLNQQERKDAACLYRSLQKCRHKVADGIYDAKKIAAHIRKILSEQASAKIEYIEIVDAKTLQPVKKINRPTLVALAVRIGQTRLIDNILIDAGK